MLSNNVIENTIFLTYSQKERDCIGSIDMKSEIEVKEEPFDIVEEEAANDELERDCYGSIDMKSEIEVKEEPFDFEEEETANDELSDKICELDQNQKAKCNNRFLENSKSDNKKNHKKVRNSCPVMVEGWQKP
ncbi:hypothetical protein Avbf_11756 [Armadillidium vulgare]|nr:hypothetical protein Avbf_11756 [Armadillidium vulgare]